MPSAHADSRCLHEAALARAYLQGQMRNIRGFVAAVLLQGHNGELAILLPMLRHSQAWAMKFVRLEDSVPFGYS